MANLAVAIMFASLAAVATAQKAASPAPAPEMPAYQRSYPSYPSPPVAEMPAYQGSYPSYASPPVAEMPAYQGSYPSHIGSPAASPSYTFPAAAPVPSSPAASPPSPAPSPSVGRRRLRVGFYRRSCPRAEKIVREAVRNATSKNPGLGAGIIRMHFHDCFVQGCDASVLLDPTAANPQPEKLSPPNFPSLRGFEVIDAAKEALENVCPGKVSCADIIAFAARDASFFLSRARINFRMPAGRLDGRVSLSSEALDFLPPPFFNLSQLVDNFRAKNLDEDDLVVLSGAHTIGVSQCSSFTDRLPPNPSDMNPAFATLLQSKCPVNPNITNDPTVVQDIVTPNRLDTRYYTNVLKRNVLFTSDAALLSSRRTTRKVVENALIPRRWERKFAKAMVKMAAIELKTAANGEIRKMCRVVNN